MIVGIIRRKPVLTYASIIFGDMLASVNSVKNKCSRYCEHSAQPYDNLIEYLIVLFTFPGETRWLCERLKGRLCSFSEFNRV